MKRFVHWVQHKEEEQLLMNLFWNNQDDLPKGVQKIQPCFTLFSNFLKTVNQKELGFFLCVIVSAPVHFIGASKSHSYHHMKANTQEFLFLSPKTWNILTPPLS